jgi:hypothetical protein
LEEIETEVIFTEHGYQLLEDQFRLLLVSEGCHNQANVDDVERSDPLFRDEREEIPFPEPPCQRVEDELPDRYRD